MSEQDQPYATRRAYRVIGHEAFAFTDNVPLKVLDKLVPDVAESVATERDRWRARRLRDNVKARNKTAKMSVRGALETMMRIGILVNALEKGEQ